MDEQHSYSVAPGDARRGRVLSVTALAALIGLSMVGLLLVFPKEDLFNRLRNDGDKTDPALTVAYLRNIVRIDEKDLDLRLLLVEKLAEQREFEQAAQALAEAKPFLQGVEQQQKWEEAQALLVWRQYQISWADQPEEQRAAYDASMRERLLAQVPHLHHTAKLLFLVQQSINLQNRELMTALFERLEQIKSAGFPDYVQAARMALGQGLFETSARLYFAARNKTADSTARNQMVMLGVKSLLASGNPLKAYEAARRMLDPLGAGDPMRWELVRLGLAAGRARELMNDLAQLLPSHLSASQLAQQFSVEQLELAQAVYLGAGLPAQALRVVQAASLQQPERVDLRELHAQVAEWSGQPQQALQLWRQLLVERLGSKALDQLFRLGPMLRDDETLLMAWHAKARQRALEPAQAEQLVQVYERLGQPQNALQWLDAELRRPAYALTLQTDGPWTAAEQMWSLRAGLLERMGRWADAIDALGQLWSQTGRLGRADAFRMALLHARQGQMPQGLAALKAWVGADGLGPAAGDVQALELLGDLAYEADQKALAYQSYRQMWQLEKSAQTLTLKSYQAERMLRHSLEQGDKAGTQALAADLYTRFKTDGVVFVWIDALMGGKKKADILAWQAGLDPEHRSRLERNPDFLARRAVLRTDIGQMKEAMADYRASLALRRSADVEISYWWLLIDQGEQQALRRDVFPRLAEVRLLAPYQEVLGASFLTFNEPRLAVEFYQRQARQRTSDYLWLTNYADVLDQVGRSDLAARVRQHAFGLLNQKLRDMAALEREQAMQALLVRLRLSEAYASGVEKERLSRLIGSAWQADRLSPQQRQQLDDLVVSWALAGERRELARQWLLQQRMARVAKAVESGAGGQARQEAVAPTQGELSYALAQQDKPALADLLARADAGQLRLHPYDRLQALRILGRYEQAADLAVSLAQRAGEGGLLTSEQEVMENDLLRLASRAGMITVQRRIGALSQRGVEWYADMALGGGWRVQARQTQLSQGTLDTSVLAAVPSRDQTRVLGVSRDMGDTQVEAQLTQKQGLAQLTGMLLRLSHVLSSRTQVRLEWGMRQGLDESPALAVAGVNDRLSLQWTHQLAKGVQLDAQWAHKRYFTQNRVYLGRGQDLSAYATIMLHGQRPQWQARVGVRRSQQSLSGQSDPQATWLNPAGVAPDSGFFLSPSTTAWSASLGYNIPEAIDAPAAYSRAWRPWAEVGFEQSRGGGITSSTGTYRMGIRSSVVGRDQLVIGVEIKPQRGGSTSRSAQLQYEWIGDR